MVIEKIKLTEVMKDLIAEKKRMENRSYRYDKVPAQYVGVAVYSHVIKKLEGLTSGE